ncbi:DUF6259 domain-containing protein [Eubacteriales bacterium OttesenSCG-928-G02]|nr:DUF6259 domain-containing protein [Eubacteriales bacterium OttesenSCG-928-G02]
MKNSETIYRIQAGELSVSFELNSSGISLYSIRDKKSKKNILTHKGELFILKARSLTDRSEVFLSSEKGWKSAKITSQSESITTLTFAENAELKDVSVIITAVADGNRITFDTMLINNSGTHALVECDYPVLRFDVNANTDFLVPYGCGEIIPANKKGGWLSTQSYPSYGASMQYMAYLNKTTKRGIYYGLHDPIPAPKRLQTAHPEGDKSAWIKAFLPLANSESGYNSQKLCGSLVWEIFDGDWYDATLLYREFVEAQAKFLPESNENGRVDLPQRFKDIDHWFMVWTKPEEDNLFADRIIEQSKIFGVNCGVHLYTWHEIPFDNDYPHYFPIKPTIRSEVDKLQAAGILVMPYINGRLWDTRDKGLEDYQFTKLAKAYCTKDPDGKPYIETYNSKESDGSKTELAVMCPSTAIWQDTMADVVGKLFDFGFDAVYMDQIAAAEAKPCTDKGHSHMPGGGEWWVTSYETMLQRITKGMDKDKIITTECTADPFMKHIAGYLTWLWVKNNQVPAFPVLYSDKVMMFGRCYYAIFDLDDPGMRITYSQSFLFGEQMGWIQPDAVDEMPHRDFFVRLVRCRSEIKRFLYAGEMLRTPEITSDLEPLATYKAREAYDKTIVYPAVNGSLWKSKANGEKLLTIVNSSTDAAKFTVKADFADGVYTTKGDTEIKIKIENGEFSAELPALSVIYIIK